MSTQTSRVAKYTTIEALEAKTTGPVYVLNSTQGELKGNLLITIQKLTGNGSDLVRIPQTFVPIDLSMQVSKRQLMASSEFRQTINKGMLKLPSPEYAKLLLESETGKEEWRRIQNEMLAAKQIVENSIVQEPSDDDYIDIPKEEVKKSGRGGEVKAKTSSKDADVKVKAMAANAKTEGWSQIRTVGALQSYGDLTKADIKHLASQFKEKDKVMKYLKGYAREQGFLTKK